MIAGFRRLLGQLRSGDWLIEGRVVGWGSILLGLEILTFVFFVAGTHGYIVTLEKPVTTDFASFYAAGVLANSDKPALAYSQPEHYAAEQDATEHGVDYVYFFYPPVFLLLCSVLARLPYLLAFVVFETVSCLAYVLVIREILREAGWTWLIPLMAFPAVWWSFGLGQNSFLTAAFFGAATVLLDRRPVMAGAILGLLCYKPHFAVLVPIVLAAGRQWTAFAAAGCAAAFLVALSGLIFGLDTWEAFLTGFSGTGAVFADGRIPFAGLVSVFAAARMAGAPIWGAYAIQAAATALVALIVGMIWCRGCTPPVRFASLLAGTLLAVPVVLIYDLLLVSVAGCWLIRAGRGAGFLNWEKTALVGTFLMPLLSRSVGLGLDIPIGPSAATILLVFCIVRSRHEHRLSRG